MSILLSAASAETRSGYFAGGGAGLSNLSADGAVTPPTGEQFRSSGFTPSNGTAVAGFGGVHLNAHVSAQGTYLYNRNTIRLAAFESSSEGLRSFEVESRQRSHSFLGEFLLYVRPRDNWFRPFLSAGVGFMDTALPAGAPVGAGGQTLPPPGEISSTQAVFRVGVGLDVVSKSGWGFRFMFGQTLRQNPFSEALGIDRQRRYATFHNVFGIVKYF